MGGGKSWASGTFFKAVVEATFFFGSNIWVMTPNIVRTLGGFHHRVSLFIVVMKPRRYVTGQWVYPPLEVDVSAMGPGGVEAYVLRRQNTIDQYIATQTIMELCLVA